MADRRMFTKKITDDDHFMSLSSSAQALYLHLSMAADDDGFCNQVTISMLRAHASVQDLQALLEQRYLLQFESGVIVIKHWRMANALRKDRYTPTAFQKELAMLRINPNGSYSFKDSDVVADWLPDGCQVVAERLPQDRLDKDRLEKDRLGKDNSVRFVPPTVEEVQAYCAEQRYKVDAQEFVDYYASQKWKKANGQPLSDWKAGVRYWARKRSEKEQSDLPYKERQRLAGLADLERRKQEQIAREKANGQITNV